MTGWLIALAVVVLLAILPLGVSASYGEAGPKLLLLAGPVKLHVFPRKKKKSATKKEKKPKKQNKVPEKKPVQTPEPAAPKGGSWKDFLPLVQVGLDFLGDLRRKLRVDRLELDLCMAGDDPCDLAVGYGAANAAMANLLVSLNRVFVIKKQKVAVRCDFVAEQMTVYARLDLTLTVGRAISLLVFYAVRGLRTYLNIMKKRKGGANL